MRKPYISLPLLVLVGFCVFSARAHAYSGFIGQGYKSCNACHYEPNGNGPLTDYGRALWGSHIAGKPPWGSDLSDEELGERSHLLYNIPFPTWFRASIDYRSITFLKLTDNPVGLYHFTMKADGTVILRTDEENRLFTVVNLGYIEDPEYSSQGQNRPKRHLISRAHYVAYRPTDELTVLAGFTDVAFGLRIPEHVAFSRLYTGLGANDQTHGLMAKLQKESWELALHGFAGNLFQKGDVQARGASGLFEYEILPDVLLGGSALYSANSHRKRAMGSVHSRAKLGEGASLISEVGLVHDMPASTGSSTGFYLFSQLQAPIVRGLFFLPTAEFYTEAQTAQFFRLGPALQWFPFQRLELRLDMRGQWQTRPTGSFQLAALGNLHISL